MLEIFLRECRYSCAISSGVDWRKPLSSMLPMISSAVLRSSAVERGLVQLAHQMLLKGLLGGDGIEEELPLFFLVLRAAAVAARLRHVIAPFVIELRQLIELLLEIFVRRLALGILDALVGRSRANSSRTGLVSISCWTRFRSSSRGAWRMSRLCCSCGARTCCRERFCD